MECEYLNFALSVALSAGRLVLHHYGNSRTFRKADGSEVTAADRLAEDLMRTMISRRFPSHHILGEELGHVGHADGAHVWVLDPIDGTSWFAMGAPLFGNLVALLEHGEPIVGVIHLPALQETLCAAKGLGCWFFSGASSPKRVRVSSPVPLSKAVVTASGTHGTDTAPGSGPHHLSNVVSGAGKFRFYGDCVQHALVCRGTSHAAIDTFMQPWDSAAIVPCIEEAGGVVTTLQGERKNVVFGGNLLTSCHPSLHEEILRLLRVENPLSNRPSEMAA